MTVPDALRPFLRTAWLPETEYGPGPPDASTFSGLAWIPEGETWPASPNCSRPMQLLLQLNTADVPEPVRQRAGDGLLQLFYCANADAMCDVELEGWEPFSRCHVARRVMPTGTPVLTAPPVEIPDRFPPKRIVGWTEVTDVPHWEETVATGLEVTDDEWDALLDGDGIRPGDKLSGWPRWVQGPERPRCPVCRRRLRKTTMEVLVQLDSEDHLPMMFGDMGTGHLSVCPRHPNVLAFGWACG
ncbi:MAG: DUF1963 domain-containing protein [Bacteroidota bacterium]